MKTKLMIIFAIGILMIGCAGQKENKVADSKTSGKAINTQLPSAEIVEKCKIFEPPWGDQNWSEWWQANPEDGEKWFSEYPLDIKTADLSVIPKCVHLEHMLVGFATLENLDYFSGLSKLKTLDLRFDKQVTDLSPLANLKNLEELNIWGTGVSDLSPLAGLEKLKFINARMTKITDLSSVVKIKNLTAIDLLRTEVSDISPLAKMEKMTEIMLCTTKVEDLSPLYPIAKRITYLDLCNTPFRKFEDLKQFTNLDTLKLWGLPLGKLDFLSGLKKLEELDLSGAEFESLAPLYEIKSLRKLTMLDTKYQQEELNTLKQRNPDLELILKLD